MNKTLRISSGSLFYAINCLYLFSILIGTANSDNFLTINISTLQSVSRYISLVVLLLLFILRHRYLKMKSMFIIIVFVIVIGTVYLRIDDVVMVFTLLFILCEKGADVKKIAQYSYKTITVTTLLIMGMCLLGVYPDIYEVRSKSTRMGHSFGFLGANAMASTIFVGLIYYVYANKDNWKRRNYLIFVGVTFCSFLITKSRMTFFLECVLLLLMIFLRKCRSRSALYKIQGYSYIILSIITLMLTKWYASNPGGLSQNVANLFTTGRLYWCYYFFKTYGFSIWGQNINLVGAKMAALTGNNWQSIDNAYAILAIHYGIVVLVVLCLGCFLLGYYLKKMDNYIGSLCVLILALWGLTENSIIIIGYNLGMYLMGDMLWNRRDSIP